MCVVLKYFELIIIQTISLTVCCICGSFSMTGAREAAFRNIKSIAECLADELINAAKVRHLPASGW